MIHHPNPVWRLIPFMEASGWVQMAIDEWLLERHLQDSYPPILRFYTWQPVAISLGYHQYHYPESWHHLIWQEKPLELVRRPTGGRAVLHQGDLTYAVITSGLTQRRREAYEILCEFLRVGWRNLGVELYYGAAGRGYIHHANCFGTATNADLILSDGSKLIGSAQLRRDSAILQQGSMQIQPDFQLWTQVFGEMPPISRIKQGFIEQNLRIATIIDVLVGAASQCFGVELVPQPLSAEEWQDILKYMASKGVAISSLPKFPHA